jgi:hypothetical protein
VLEHAQGLHTWYAHNSVVTRQPGEWVNPGETIALVGASGRATGPHLHFEVRVQGQAIDPLQYLASLNMDQNQLAKAPSPPVPEVRPHWVGPTTKPIGAPSDNAFSVEVLSGSKSIQHWFK